MANNKKEYSLKVTSLAYQVQCRGCQMTFTQSNDIGLSTTILNFNVKADI